MFWRLFICCMKKAVSLQAKILLRQLQKMDTDVLLCRMSEMPGERDEDCE